MTEPESFRLIVTIDGPAASGKSSVARLVAGRLSVPYVSSGLVYRAVAVAARSYQVDPNDAAGLSAMLDAHSVALMLARDGNRVSVDGLDVTEVAETSRVDATVSLVAAHAPVRAWVNKTLRALPGSFVAEGRDMGASVFPSAQVKIFLTAPAGVRARRRVKDRTGDLPAIQANIEGRDATDALNSVPSPDAILLDTTPLSLDGVVKVVLAHVSRAKERLMGAAS